MSGTNPTPSVFGSDEAAKAQNPRSEDQMTLSVWPTRATDNGGAGTDTSGWWAHEPVRTGLATTTGQNLEGTNNAFDTDWWNRASEQDKAFQEAGQQKGRWSVPNATGIATHSFGQDGNVPAGLEGEVVKFGDVFDNGAKVGNIYEGYGGMTVDDADEIMGRLVLPREVWAAAYQSEAGRGATMTGSLREEINAAAAKETEDFTKGLTAADFEDSVEERAAGYENDDTAQVTNIGAGAAGGALTGAGVAAAVAGVTGGIGGVAAPIIIGAGAAIGALGAYLNRDEVFRSVATAQEQLDRARADDLTGIGLADAVGGWTGVAAQKLNPTNNLLHGWYDSIGEGGAGDSSARWQDEEVPLWMHAPDMATLLVDGVGTFGTKWGARVFTATMGSGATAGGYGVAAGIEAGNVAFNPYSGAYEDIGARGMALQGASVGIDLAQTGAAGILNRVTQRTVGTTLFKAEQAGGHRITVSGGVQSARVGLSMLLPSEAATGITARAFARRALNATNTPVTREAMQVETARQIQKLSSGQKSIALAAVNGFGEGGEEAVQAVLDAQSFNEMPTIAEVLSAAKQGFAMGAGMGVAIGVNGRSVSATRLNQANVVRAIQSQDQYSQEAWDKLTPTEQALAATVPDAEVQETLEGAARIAFEEGMELTATSAPMLTKLLDVAKAAAEQDLANSQPNVEMSQLSIRSNHAWAPNDYVISVTAAVRMLTERTKMYQAALDGTDYTDATNANWLNAEEVAKIEPMLKADQALLQRIKQYEAAVDELKATLDPAAARAEIFKLLQGDGAKAGLNQILRDWYGARTDGRDPLAAVKRRSGSVWTARYPLNAAGSFQLLRLQIDPEMTFAGVNNAALAPIEIQDPMGGDFDGDRISTMMRNLLSDDTFNDLRQGASFLMGEGVMLGEKTTLQATRALLSLARSDPAGTSFRKAQHYLNNIRSELNALLAKSEMPSRDRRRMVADFVNRLDSYDRQGEKTVKDFMSTLAREYQPAMQGLAERQDNNPYLQMYRIVFDNLWDFQTSITMADGPLIYRGATKFLATAKHMPRSQMALTAAASDLATAMIGLERWETFRVTSTLKYNELREPTTDSVLDETDQADMLDALFRKFMARNDGLVRDGADAAFEGSIVQRRTYEWLKLEAHELATDMNLSDEQAMIVLAWGRMADVDSMHQDRVRSKKDARFLQVLLRRVTDEVRREYRELAGDPAVAARLASLDSLTNPDFDMDGKTHAQGGDAIVEVFGHTPIVDIVGAQAQNLAGYTFRNLRDKLIGMHWSARAELVRSMTTESPQYEDIGGRPAPYKAAVDAIVESANMHLSEDRSTGDVSGSIALPDRRAHDDFMKVHYNVRKLLGFPKTAAEVRAALARDARLESAVVNLMSKRSASVGAQQVDGTIKFPMWIYGIFAESEGNLAEMDYLRWELTSGKAHWLTEESRKEAEKAKKKPKKSFDEADVRAESMHEVNDTILRLWLELSYKANRDDHASVEANIQLRKFVQALRDPQMTVTSFIRFLNTGNFRGENDAPFMAWVRDTSVTEVDRFGKGISSIQEGVEIRDALRAAVQVSEATMRSEDSVTNYGKTIAELVAEIDREREQMGDRGTLWRRFVAHYELSQKLPTLVSWSMWLKALGGQGEIRGDQGVKGNAPENVAPMGPAAAAQIGTFDHGFGRIMASATSGNLQQIQSDMTLLSRGDRQFVLDDGTVVNFEAMTAEQTFELLKNPRTAGMAARIMGMSVWDFSEDLQQNILASLYGEGLAAYIADPTELLFQGPAAASRRMEILEGLTGKPGGVPVLPSFVAKLMAAAETGVDHVMSDRPGAGGTTERTRLAQDLFLATADVLDKFSRINGLYTRSGTGIESMVDAHDEQLGMDIPLLNKTLLDAVRMVRTKSPSNKSWLAQLLPPEPGPLRERMFTMLAAYAEANRIGAIESGNKDLEARANEAIDALEKSEDYTSPLDILIAEYGDTILPSTRVKLMEHVSYVGDLANRAAWAAPAIRAAFDPRRGKETVTADGVQVDIPILSDSEWQTLGEAVIAYTMAQTYGPATAATQQISKFSLKAEDIEATRALWDPTYTEMLAELMVPGLLKDPKHAQPSPLMLNSLSLTRELGGEQPTVEPQEATEAAYRLIAPLVINAEGQQTGRTGQWNPMIPQQALFSIGTMAAAAAPMAVQMAGLTQEQTRFLLATTRHDYTAMPPEEELSQARTDAMQLITAVEQKTALTSYIEGDVYGRTVQVPRVSRIPMSQIEGHYVRRIVVTAPGVAPEEMLTSNYRHGLLPPGRMQVEGSPVGVVNFDTLSHGLVDFLQTNNVPKDEWENVSVEIDFWHETTKTISSVRPEGDNWSNNSWFDGVSAATSAAWHQQSLMGELLFALDGEVAGAYTTALDALKKLHAALQDATMIPEAARRAWLHDGLTDMDRMLHGMTTLVLQQKIDGKELRPRHYNAVHKLLELMHVVRYVDEQGQPHVLSSEEMIARQLRGEEFPENSAAEVVGLPLSHVLVAMGELDGKRMNVTPWEGASYNPNLSKAKQYTRFPDHLFTDQMFGQFLALNPAVEGEPPTWATVDLLELPEINNQRLPKSMPRTLDSAGAARPSSKMLSDIREHDDIIVEKRQRHQDALVYWANRAYSVDQFVATKSSLIGVNAFLSAQAKKDGDILGSATMQALIPQTPINNATVKTVWVYVHNGSSVGGVSDGVLVRSSEIDENVIAMDRVVVYADSFVEGIGIPTEKDTFPKAREVLDRLVGRQVPIELPEGARTFPPLRSAMIRYLRAQGYAQKDATGAVWVPRVRVEQSQTNEAMLSTLREVRRTTSQNRVVVSTSAANSVEEGTAHLYNGGLEKMGSITVAESVQTARYAGYAPLTNGMAGRRIEAINLLLPLVAPGSRGRAYFLEMARAGSEESGEYDETMRALDKLHLRLQSALTDPDLPLVPYEGETDFGTGDIIPLLQLGQDGITGVHLMIHGHVPLDRRLMTGAPPKGNQALVGGKGVRLTIDTAKVDDEHTTTSPHARGTVVETSFLGQVGMQLRIEIPITDENSKFTLDQTAYKATTAQAPQDEQDQMPKRNILAGMPVVLGLDMQSSQDKGAGKWELSNVRNIVEAVGFDALPHMVRYFFQDTAAPLGSAEYYKQENQVKQFVVAWARVNGEVVDAATLVEQSNNGELMATLHAAAMAAAKEMKPDHNPNWDLNTDERIADATISMNVLSAVIAGANMDIAFGAPGFADSGLAASSSHTMHPVFTTLMNRLPLQHPARLAFVDQVNARLNTGYDEGFMLQPNFSWIRFGIRPDGTPYQIEDMLSFVDVSPTDTNETLSEMAWDRKQKGNVSPTTLAMTSGVWGASLLAEGPLKKGTEIFDPNRLVNNGDGGLLLDFSRQITPPMRKVTDDENLVPIPEARQHIERRALPAMEALRVRIDTSHWFDEMPGTFDKVAATAKYMARRNEAKRALHINSSDKANNDLIDELIRTAMVRPATAKDEREFLTYNEAMQALEIITKNARAGRLPTEGLPIPVVRKAIMDRLQSSGFTLTRKDGKKEKITSPDGFRNYMLETLFVDDSARAYPAVSNILDGIMYTYRNDIKGLPDTISKKLGAAFRMARTSSGMLLLSNHSRRIALNPLVQDGQVVRDLEDLETTDTSIERLDQDARRKLEVRMTNWENKHDMRRERKLIREEIRNGSTLREQFAGTNVMMRWTEMLYVLKTMINPGLFVGAFIELANKGVQERLVSALAGETARQQEFTPEQMAHWREVEKKLAGWNSFYAMVYRNTVYQQGEASSSKEEKVQRLTGHVAGAFNDVQWGSFDLGNARTFMERAWAAASHRSQDGTVISIEMFLKAIETDPASLAKLSPDALAMGLRGIEYGRNLQDNLINRMTNKATNKVIGSGRIGATLGVLLMRIPLKFIRFRSNTLINMFGAQAAFAVFEMLTNDRKRRKGGLGAMLRGETEDIEVSDAAKIEDSYDLTRAILRSGVSHTQLLMLGTVLSSLGFGGDEDDESKLLNKLRRYQKAYVAKDPLDLQNDFRNAQAWFNELLPAGMGVPSWILKPFVSPAMGIARYIETGEFRQVYYGFADALGNLPLLNIDTVLNGWELAQNLTAAAEAETQDESDEATSNAAKLMYSSVSILESLLFEVSFASLLYQASDEYDRDPYVVPMKDSNGVLQTDATGQSRETDALVEYTDPVTGEIKQAYRSRDDGDAFIRGLAENRPILASVMALIHADSSYLRTNMVPKIREYDTEEISTEEARDVVLSIYNNETGTEELTLEGAAATVRGIHLGTVALDSPALNGIFISAEMRADLRDLFLEEYATKYAALPGVTKSEALSMAKTAYYGQEYGAPEQLGISDILTGNYIPQYQTQKYYQLNTTYVAGPNGYPIATGLQRSVLTSMGLNLNGYGVFDTYGRGENSAALPVDQLLNSVDAGRGLNTGQRNLEKVDEETWFPKTAEEIAEEIDASLEKIADKIDDLQDNLNGGYGYSGYGGYGGYGGGYSSGGYSSSANYGGGQQRLNTPNGLSTPYALSPRTAYSNNPIIRRATIRRERFSSERGRLNQWQ